MLTNIGSGFRKFMVFSLAATLVLSGFFVAPLAQAATTVVVSGNTAAGENQPGWLFNRDTGTQTPYEFNLDQASLGNGSLFVPAITNTGNGNNDKFIAENFLLTPVADVASISYDFLSASSASDAGQFYMNVYANFGESSPTKYYDCRYNIVPSVGSTTEFTAVTFDPTLSYPVTTRTGASASPYTCPSVPADMDTLSTGSSTIRVIALNVGDTSGSDTGVSGYLDNVVVTTTTGVTTSDFDPVVVTNDESENYLTIQAAVTGTNAGGTITVPSGTFNESVVVDKALTVNGSGSTKPVIAGNGVNYIVKVEATSNVVLNNLEINGGVSNTFNYGVLVNNAGTTEIKNSVIKNVWNSGANALGVENSTGMSVHDNIISSFHKNGTRWIKSSGQFSANTITGDSVDGTSRVQNLVNIRGGSNVEIFGNTLSNAITDPLVTPTWDSVGILVSAYLDSAPYENSTANIHDNEISYSDSGIVITSIYADPDGSSATVTNNNLHNLNWGINFEKESGSAVVHNNSFTVVNSAIHAEGDGIVLSNPPPIEAQNNWWGSASPDFASLVYTGVTTVPWYTNAAMTTLSDATTTDANFPSSGSGEVTVPSDVSEIELTDGNVIDLSDGVDPLTSSVTLNSDQPIVVTNTDVSDVSYTLPEDVTIEGPTGWDGQILPPMDGTDSGVAPAGFQVGDKTIEVGSADGTLVFSEPVTILFENYSGPVAYRPALSNNWVQITNICADPYATPGNPPPDSECAITNGTDTKIVTFHFTTFSSLQTIGGGGGGGGGSITPPTPTPPVVVAPPVVTPPLTPPGQVLGSITFSNGTLVKTADSPTVYLVVNRKLRPFNAAAIFRARGLKFSDIQIIGSDLVTAENLGKVVGYPDGTLIRGSGPTVYKVSGDAKQGIPSMAAFRKMKLSLRKIVRVNDADLANYDDGGIAQ